MAFTVNILSDDDALLRTDVGNWEIENYTSYAIDLNEVVYPGFGTIRVDPDVIGEPVVFRLNNIPLAITSPTAEVQFHCRIKSLSTCITTVTLTNTNSDTVVRDTQTNIDLWSIVRSAQFPHPDIGEQVSVNIEVSVCGHLGETVYFTMPFMYYTNAFAQDLFMQEAFLYLPEIIRRADAEHAELHDLPDFPLARIMELTTGTAGQAFRDYYNFEYRDVEAGKDPSDITTLSTLVDPTAVLEEYAPWLSQFAGVLLDNPTSGSTPWDRLPQTWKGMQEDIDPEVNPTFTPTSIVRSENEVTATIGAHSLLEDQWVSVTGVTPSSFNGGFAITAVDTETITWVQEGADESASTTGLITGLDTEWQEIEAFDPGLDNLDDYLRWQIQYAYNGINAGTKSALVESVSRELTDTKTVTVFYQHEGNPWKILVRTKTSETPEATEGEPSPVIENYIRKVKPAGFQVLHECTATGT